MAKDLYRKMRAAARKVVRLGWEGNKHRKQRRQLLCEARKKVGAMLAVLLLLSVAPAAVAGELVAPGALTLAAAGADIVTTEAALRRPGAFERNPLLRGGPGERIAIKAATAGLAYGVHVYLAKRGHKKAAWLVTAAYVGANVALAINNGRAR